MMINNHAFLDPVLTEQAQKVYENGIGYVNGAPHVADWFVPYEVPIKLIGQDWNEKKIELPVFPMRGSKLGVHVRVSYRQYSRKYEGEYYLAHRLGKKVASMMQRKKSRIISFKLNKYHYTFSHDNSSQDGACWNRTFAGAFLRKALDLGWDEINIRGLHSAGGVPVWRNGKVVGCSDYAIAYTSGLSQEKAQAVRDLLRQWGGLAHIEECAA